LAEDILFDLLNVPPLRFPEFKGEWKKSQLGSVVSNKCQKYTPSLNEHLFDIELDSIESDNGICSNFYDSSTQKSVKNCFTSQNVLYGKLRPYLNKWYLPKQNGVCSSEIWVLSSKALKRAFLFSIIQGKSFKSGSNVSSGSKMPRADWNYIESIPVSFPGDEEQEKIGLFVLLIEKRIEVQRKIIEDHLLLEKALCIFPQNAPQEKLENLCTSLSSTLQESQVEKHGLYPVFGANGVVGYRNDYQSAQPGVAIIKDGAGVGRAFTIIDEKYSILSTLSLLLPKKECPLSFLYYALKKTSFRKYIEGSGIPHIYFDDYKNAFVPKTNKGGEIIASLIEINKGNIEVSRKMLFSLEDLKEFLLENLFC
jgi:type I restriction enzyme S subunit